MKPLEDIAPKNLKKQPYFLIKSIQKAFLIFEIVCDEGEIGLSELCRRIDLKKSNLHRILATLEYLGYISREPATSKYRPTLKTFEIGNAAINRIEELQTCVHPFLEQLGKQFHETNNLGLLDRGEVVYIDRVVSRKHLKLDFEVGSRVPAYCTSLGKVLLAHLTELELNKYLRTHKLLPRTKNTVTSPQHLKKVLRQILVKGYAIDNQELSEGVTCIGVPIRNYTAKVVAAISISGPSIRMDADRLAQIRGPLITAAGKISKKLGYSDRG
jgi:DNA-binding IclR family transcriptional regulator